MLRTGTRVTRGVAKAVKRDEPKCWVVSYLKTARSRKPVTRAGYGETPEEAINWVTSDIEQFNKECSEFGCPPDKFFKVVSVEPYIEPWKRVQ